MKIYKSLRLSVILFACMSLFVACEQEYFEPNTTTAPGGGTVTTYKAYTLESTDDDNVFGRVVFYRYSNNVTLVQMGLYNTDPDASYSAEIFSGAIAGGSSTVVRSLDGVSGETGAFVTSKYVTISDGAFYDGLSILNANVKVMKGAVSVAAGDIGANASPVAEQD